jgi:hypothetical protein
MEYFKGVTLEQLFEEQSNIRESTLKRVRMALEFLRSIKRDHPGPLVDGYKGCGFPWGQKTGGKFDRRSSFRAMLVKGFSAWAIGICFPLTILGSQNVAISTKASFSGDTYLPMYKMFRWRCSKLVSCTPKAIVQLHFMSHKHLPPALMPRI